MKAYFFVFLIIIGSFYSCKKYGNGYIKGTVYEIGTGIPYKNAVVYLARDESYHAFNGSANTHYTKIDSITQARQQFKQIVSTKTESQPYNGLKTEACEQLSKSYIKEKNYQIYVGRKITSSSKEKLI